MERGKHTIRFIFLALLVITVFIISCQVSIKPDMGQRPEPPPEAPQHEGPIRIAGVWDSNIGLTYHIGQDGPHFTWETVKNGNPTGQVGKGSMEGEAIFASWKGGPQGPGESKGRIVHVNEHGDAIRIEWENGVVFFRE